MQPESKSPVSSRIASDKQLLGYKPVGKMRGNKFCMNFTQTSVEFNHDWRIMKLVTNEYGVLGGLTFSEVGHGSRFQKVLPIILIL